MMAKVFDTKKLSLSKRQRAEIPVLVEQASRQEIVRACVSEW